MKRLKNFIPIALVCILNFCSGCSSTSAPDEDTTTRFQTLTSTVWRLTQAVAVIHGKKVLVTPQFPYHHLSFSGTGSYNADNGKKQGFFTVLAARQTIIFDEQSQNTSSAQILELQTTTLRLRQLMPVNGERTTVELVFSPVSMGE